MSRFFTPKIVLYTFRSFNSKVPKIPHKYDMSCEVSNDSVKIDLDTIIHLEKLSLVNFGNLNGVKILESSIKFAQPLSNILTTGIQPLTTLLENRILPLRENVITDGSCRKAVMANAKVTEEEYFVAPPGNIPLEPQNPKIFKKLKTN